MLLDAVTPELIACTIANRIARYMCSDVKDGPSLARAAKYEIAAED